MSIVTFRLPSCQLSPAFAFGLGCLMPAWSYPCDEEAAPAAAAAVTEPEPGAVPAPFDDAVTAAAADHSDSLPPVVPDYATVTAADASHVED